ncbi:CRAL-TRIO domain-containing protein [Aspergillus egyptiacus]|nr:CRAL-TRIO domain-containing protein [Aspergillus egyptiacus]
MVGLRTEEASALTTFRGLCAEQGLLKRRDGLKEDDLPDGVCDEGTLLRFLRAKQLNPTRALEQYQQAIKFHTENNAVRLYDEISVDDYEDSRCLYPSWTGRTDRAGRPIFMFDLNTLSKENLVHWRRLNDMPKSTDVGGSSMTPNMAQRMLVCFDAFTRFALPLCSAARAEPVTQCVYLVDAACLSLKQAWDVREFARDSSWILATCYPETIHRIYACNVPSYMAKLWRLLKPLIDPVTAEKIEFVYSADAYSMLSEDIDHDNIPTNFGGGFQFTTGMLPDLGPEIRKSLQWSCSSAGENPNLNLNLPPGPIKWVRGPKGEMKAIATGRVDGVQRTEEVAVVQRQSE